jgi:sugar lactone lactonase YvrE
MALNDVKKRSTWMFQKNGLQNEPTVAHATQNWYFLLNTWSGNEERQYHSYQRCTLNESGSQDHVTTDIAGSFWLTGDALNCFTTDLANAKTCADYCEACTNCCVHIRKIMSDE